MHPILFTIFGFKVYAFGVAVLVAFLAAQWLAAKRAEKFGFTKDQVTSVTVGALVAGVLGARILFIVQELGYYTSHPKELFSIQFQGLTSFGGIIAGALYVIFWCWRHKISTLKLVDLLAGPFLLAHAIGRIGCLMNGCCYGGVCTLPWGVHTPDDAFLHHPAQAYDSLMNLAAMFIVLRMDAKDWAVGRITGYFLVLHGLARFIYEFWRAGSSSTYWGNLPITQAQGMALLLMLFGAFFVWRSMRTPVAQQEAPSP